MEYGVFVMSFVVMYAVGDVCVLLDAKFIVMFVVSVSALKLLPLLSAKTLIVLYLLVMIFGLSRYFLVFFMLSLSCVSIILCTYTR